MRNPIKINRLAALAAVTFCMLTLGACRSYIRYRYGMHQPREETPAGLTQFLIKNRFPTANQYIFRDSACFSRLVADHSFAEHLIGHMVFDRRGVLLQRDTTTCQWAGADKILALHPDSTYPAGIDMRLQDILDCIVPLDGQPGEVPADPDFTVVVTWAKFLGRYNYRLFDLEAAVAGNSVASIRLVWLNTDMQRSWELRANQRIRVK